jgi:hypothetical protein
VKQDKRDKKSLDLRQELPKEIQYLGDGLFNENNGK